MTANFFNLHISLPAGIEGIIPREEVQYLEEGEEVKDIAILTRVGKIVCFKISGFNTLPSGKTVAYLSRKEAQRECIENYISTLILHHDNIAVGEVEHLGNTVHHGITQSDDGVDTAQADSADQVG